MKSGSAMKMVHESDPKEEVRKAVGDLSGITLMHNQILIGTYVRPEKTASGVYLPNQTRKEDIHQGKVGLVLMKGPLAFMDDERNKFHGQNVEVGDWVFYRVSDGWQLNINDHHCRMMEEVHIRGKLKSPDSIY